MVFSFLMTAYTNMFSCVVVVGRAVVAVGGAGVQAVRVVAPHRSDHRNSVDGASGSTLAHADGLSLHSGIPRGIKMEVSFYFKMLDYFFTDNYDYF